MHQQQQQQQQQTDSPAGYNPASHALAVAPSASEVGHQQAREGAGAQAERAFAAEEQVQGLRAQLEQLKVCVRD